MAALERLVSAGAVDALIGVGVGAVLGFISAQLTERLRRRERSRSAARLVWTELGRSEALANAVMEYGPGPGGVVPRFVFWDTHAASLAQVVHPDVLIDLEVAYGAAEILGTVVTSDRSEAEFRVPDFQAWVQQLRDWISAGKVAIEPYAQR